MMLTDLADVLRDGGLAVIEEPGWRDRGHGPMEDVLGVTCHHTANGGAKGTEPSREVIRDGRPGLPGPLAQLLLRTDGVYRVIAAGLCYHAGVSRSRTMTNKHRIGIEAEAKGVPGTASDWPDVQMDAYALGCWVLSQHYRFDVSQVLGHKETCAPLGRKTDPDFGMTAFRARVRAAGKPKPPVKGNDMTTAALTAVQVAEAVWKAKPATVGQETGGALHELDLRSASTEKRLRLIENSLAEIKDQTVSNGGQLSNITTELASLRKVATQQAQLITDLLAAITPPPL